MRWPAINDGVAMTASPLITFKDISKVYGRGEATIRALDKINLSISAGEFVSIMGPSGSGKSTAMNIIGGLDMPSSGEYLFQGIPTSDFSREQLTLLRRHMLGFVFQGFNLLARTSAVENVELPLVYRGMDHAERRRRAMAALAQVGLKGRESHTSQELSGGQQQRVAIARAIVTDPAVLLADEPTGNLDTRTSVEIMDLITRLNRDNGITVIMVTHEEDIAAYAKRLLRFVDGHLVTDETRAEEASHAV
jgi:putative ABC transport system ATP-binding protein